MSYAIEHKNTNTDQTDGPFRTGEYEKLEDAKLAGEAFAKRENVSNVVIRDNGGSISFTAGNLVSELIDGEWHDRGMFDVKNWWPKLDDDTRAWLLEHTDEQVPAEILHRVVAVGGTVPGTKWDGQDDYDFRLPQAAADWITSQRPE